MPVEGRPQDTAVGQLAIRVRHCTGAPRQPPGGAGSCCPPGAQHDRRALGDLICAGRLSAFVEMRIPHLAARLVLEDAAPERFKKAMPVRGEALEA